MAIKNFAYAAVISGKKTNGETEWKFGFDPAVFSTRDILQASRSQTKLFERNSELKFDATTLQAVKAEEKSLCDNLLRYGTDYEEGKGYQQLVND